MKAKNLVDWREKVLCQWLYNGFEGAWAKFVPKE